MKKMILFAAAVLLTFPAMAKVTPAEVISDNMVLQQTSDVALWGWAKPGAKIKITADWNAEASAKAGKDGKWATTIKTPAAGGPYTLKFNDGEETVVSNILIGEVWFCSGQSNMEMPVRGFSNQPVTGSEDLILGARPGKPIRFCKIKRNAIDEQQEHCGTEWKLNTPGDVAGISATAYVFGKYLQDMLDVPVGLICSSWGGTPIEAWMTKEYVEKAAPGWKPADNAPVQKQIATLFNGMVAPVIPFTIKGWIWYQGEDNKGRWQTYQQLMEEYAAMMRAKWNKPDMPFYFVQIAPYNYGKPEDTQAAMLMEAQCKASRSIPNSGMATTVDAGEPKIIHPARKVDVGKRLAMLALVNTYKFKGVEASAPTFESAEFKDGAAIVKLSASNTGVTPKTVECGFELAGADKVFHPAKGEFAAAKGSKDIVFKVKSEEVPEPVAVRYCFHNWSVGTIKNMFGVPVGPFRSDDWEK